MQGDSNVPLVPWSRHLGASSKKFLAKNCPENVVDWQLSNYEKRKLRFVSRRNAISEADLVSGSKPRVAEEDNNWDSQSDPGSVISKKFSDDRSIQLENFNQDMYVNKGKCKLGQLRRRKRPLDSKSAQENDFVVEMPIQAVVKDQDDVSYMPYPKYVHHYFDFIYYCCLTPNKWDRAETSRQNSRQFALSVIQKVRSNVFNCVSIIMLCSQHTVNFLKSLLA